MYSSADLVTANIDAASAVLVSRFQCANCCSVALRFAPAAAAAAAAAAGQIALAVCLHVCTAVQLLT